MASRFSRTADEINTAVERLERVVRQLDDTSGVLRSTKANATDWDRTAAAMSRPAEALAYATQAHYDDQVQVARGILPQP